MPQFLFWRLEGVRLQLAYAPCHPVTNTLWERAPYPNMEVCSYLVLYFVGVGWDRVHLVRRPLTGLLYQPRMVRSGSRIGRGNWRNRRKTAPVSLCSPQIPHDLTWPRTRSAALGSRWLTAWAMTRQWKCVTDVCNSIWKIAITHLNRNQKVQNPRGQFSSKTNYELRLVAFWNEIFLFLALHADNYTFVHIYSHVWVTIDGVWVGNYIYWIFISSYSAIANSHTLQFSTARTKSFQSAVSSPVVVW
jgi:hypothetical protein